ncbi:hypothetical protein BKA62DRAFT_771552 [Auriculariales sp. MPI-PUGE-AT-0066]|nr:hypothetical protein BKA62DRAFT_771552 [Auriculariales sp. MPI-PUGE-AT-0066]
MRQSNVKQSAKMRIRDGGRLVHPPTPQPDVKTAKKCYCRHCSQPMTGHKKSACKGREYIAATAAALSLESSQVAELSLRSSQQTSPVHVYGKKAARRTGGKVATAVEASDGGGGNDSDNEYVEDFEDEEGQDDGAARADLMDMDPTTAPAKDTLWLHPRRAPQNAPLLALDDVTDARIRKMYTLLMAGGMRCTPGGSVSMTLFRNNAVKERYKSQRMISKYEKPLFQAAADVLASRCGGWCLMFYIPEDGQGVMREWTSDRIRADTKKLPEKLRGKIFLHSNLIASRPSTR